MNEIICKICNSKETIRSFAMHLRWNHPTIKTEDYIKIYGEFRPKQLKQNDKKELSNISCEICKEKLSSNQHLMNHITKKHKNITKEEYIVKYFYDNKHPVCKCGCGEMVKILPHGKTETGKNQYHVDYVKGHWDWVKPGFHYHNRETKEKMRKSAIKRIENEKGLFKGVSKYETELIDFIKSIYKNNIIQNDTEILSGLELDLYIPELKLAIEFNGTYYHSDLFKTKDYHLKKTKECNNKGIKLIHIWDADWIYKKEIVKSMLSSQLNNINKKIYARKCNIKIVDTNTSVNFLNDNHLQGNAISNINLGLYYNDELVLLMTFSKLRKNLNLKHIEDYYELLRFCTKLNTQVIGGASKLFNFFIKTFYPKGIISYANRDWSEGNVYKNLGMEFIKYTSPGYHWYKSKIRYNRFTFRKDVLVKQGYSPDKTEYEIMLERGFYRTWNTGNLKFSKVFI